jgi:hypothetical protein
MKLKRLSANVTELVLENKGIHVLFSYETPVAAFVPGPGNGYIRTSERYSSTTSKHITQWLNGTNATMVDQTMINDLVDG